MDRLLLQYAEDSYEKDLASALLMSKLEVEEKKVVGEFTLGGGGITKGVVPGRLPQEERDSVPFAVWMFGWLTIFLKLVCLQMKNGLYCNFDVYSACCTCRLHQLLPIMAFMTGDVDGGM